MDEIVFTPAAVLDLLTQIEELEDYEIGIKDGVSGKLQVTVGESVYTIDTNNVAEVHVDESTVNDVEDVNQDAYSSMSDLGEVELEPINSGIIKQFAKTLLVGGLVRLTSKILSKE